MCGFDSPILVYGSYLWGSKVYNTLERVYLRFCKFLLHVPASACKLACYGELGLYPVELRAKMSVIVTDWSIYR